MVHSKPNVILILTNDQGYGDFSCHGNPVLKTPNLDRLHDQGIRFTDFHVTPMCTPTRGQLLTGRDALASGAYCVCSGRTFLHPSVPTMAELFAANGYRTGMFGKWHLGDNYPHRPNDRGFAEAVYHLSWGNIASASIAGLPRPKRPSPRACPPIKAWTAASLYVEVLREGRSF